ncbi:MAG TPA: DUF177 domain-containing protein [Blastocatellia bacterium]|jgi:uncharacterized protein
MNISIFQITEDEGLNIHHLYPEGEPFLSGGDSRLVGRPELDLQATRAGDEIRLAGHLRATVEMDCDRCLKPLTIPVDQSFDLLYVPPAKTSEEKELGDDDLSIAFYHDQAIDIDDVVREQVELALPMARLCGQECRGLCAHCGANLNEGDCLCSEEQVDPRWSTLKELKSNTN